MNQQRVGDVLIRHEPGVVWAIFDRPQVRNAISEGLVDGVDAAVESAIESEARVLVLRGAGGTFCAGADLQYVSQLVEDEDGLQRYVTRLATVLDRLEAAPFATVAVIEGFALAGGCEILLACDMSIAAADAWIGDRHLEYGLLPGAGGSVRLPRAVSSPRARYLLMTGEMIDGATAAAWGLVTFAVPTSELEPRLDVLISRLASRSLDAVGAVKRMVVETRDASVSAGVALEREIFTAYFRECRDGREGLAAFREKRRPNFSRPRDALTTEEAVS